MWSGRDRLVVFDGLDEVPTTATTDLFFQKIGEFCRAKADGRRTQLIFTSRNKDDADRFANDSADVKFRLQAFELQPLNDGQIRKLCASLGQVFWHWDSGFFYEIQRLDKEIKTNPLLVSQLAIIFNNYGSIPSDSMVMTEKLAEIVFGVEDRADVLEVKGVEIGNLRALVEAFAALQYEYPEENDVDVMDAALNSCNEHAVPTHVLEYFKKRAIYVDGRYLHKSLGEFFAAYGFARRACGLGGKVKDKELLDFVISHCGDDSWGSIVNWFVRKTKLKTLVIPEGVKRIGGSAFFKCSSLTRVVISDSVTTIGGGAFSGCRGLTNIVIPDSVTSIGSSAFYRCSGLTSIVIPDSVVDIGFGAFEDCSGLTSVTIGNGVTNIDNYAFKDCDSLTKIIIPSNARIIGDHAFENCSSLNKVVIPNGVMSIGEFAFAGCAFFDIKIPRSVSKIGKLAFTGCSNLTSIVVEEGNRTYYSVGNCLIETEQKALIAGCKNSIIPNDGSVTSIGEGVFWKCRSLESIILPNGLTSIDFGMFAECVSLRNIILPDTITSIRSLAFQNCTALERITLPQSVTHIGFGVFNGCSSLKSILYTGDAQQFNNIIKCDEWKPNSAILYIEKEE